MMNFYFFLMMMFFIFFVVIMMFMSNLNMFSPIMLSFLLMMYTIIMCFQMNFLSFSYWFSYILFLVMIGGLMILFIYFTSLASNYLFYIKLNYSVYFFLKILYLLMILLIIFFNKEWLMNLFIMENSFEVWNLLMLCKDFMKILYLNLMMDFCMDMNLYMIFYLFLTMISVVLICLKFYLPLRQLIKY